MNIYSRFILSAFSVLCMASCMGTDESGLAGDFRPPQLSIADPVISDKTVSVTLNAGYKLNSPSSVIDGSGFYFGDKSDLTSAERLVAQGKSGVFSIQVTPEDFDKQYFYKAYLSNGKSEVVSKVMSFQMPDFEYFVQLDNPVVQSSSGNKVKVSSTISKASGINLSEAGICYGTDREITIEDTKVVSASTDVVEADIKGLSLGEKYYMCAYVMDREYIAYSEVIEFTPHSVPSLSTKEVSDINYTTSVSGGYAISDNGLAVTEKGVVWSTQPNPTIDSSAKTQDDKGNDDYYSHLSGLLPGTKYYVRAYAVNSDGVGYGNEISFETLSQSNATVLTTFPSEITGNSAVSGGNITSDGGANVTTRGVVWNTDHNPTISLDTKTSDGTGTGKFISNIDGLAPGTTYYLRAYATNSIGTSYGDEVSFTTKAVKPTVTTSDATSVTASSATLGGNVTATGGADVTERGVVWGTSQNPTTSGNKKQVGSGAGSFSTELTGLELATTYYVRAYAINSVGTSYGEEISFTTGSEKPAVTTTPPTDIASSSAKSGGHVTSDGGANVTSRGVVWNTDHNPTISLDTKTSDGTGTGKFISNIDGLAPGTTYYLRAYATNKNGTSYGDEVSFTTEAVKPTVTTSDATSVTASSATVGGNVTATGGADVTERGVVWGTSQNPTTSGNKKQVGSGAGSFSTELTGLELATTYYVRAYAINSVGTSYGEEISFTTGSEKPAVTTTPPTDITSSSAKSGGYVTSDGGASVTARGVVWSKDHNPAVSLSTKTTDGTGEGTFISSVSGLAPGTTYYLRAYATNKNGTSYGDEVSFTTKAVKPTVTTSDATSVTASSVTLGGNVTATGGADVTERGVVWGTSQNPTTSGNKKQVGSGAGSFSTELTGLELATTYYVRAYAINSVGTSYGEEVSFTTLVNLPTVMTLPISSISSRSAVSGGNITSNGGASVISCGIVWSTSPNPTISLSTKTAEGNKAGNFNSNMQGLKPNTTYYVRAYATNSRGTAYGDQITFTTKAEGSNEDVGNEDFEW